MYDTLIQDHSLPRCAFMLFSKATVHSSGIHFGLCLHDCLLSIRQDYLGELCWPFTWVIFSSKGSFSTGAFICTWATLLFLVLGWCLTWKKDVSFPNSQAGHLDFCPSWLYSGLSIFDCSLAFSWDYQIAAYV